jgi:hypothetical protein
VRLVPHTLRYLGPSRPNLSLAVANTAHDLVGGVGRDFRRRLALGLGNFRLAADLGLAAPDRSSLLGTAGDRAAQAARNLVGGLLGARCAAWP